MQTNDGKRKYINKLGFKTKAEAEKLGIIAYKEYTQTGCIYEYNNLSWIKKLRNIFKKDNIKLLS